MKGRFFAVLLLTQVGSGTSGASPTPDDYLERGNALIAAQSWTECQALFEEALQEDAENLVYRSQLGLCLTGRGEYEGAAEQLRQVLAVDPENAGALWYLAVNRHLARDHRAAIYQLQLVEPRLEPQAPTRAALLWYLGQSYKALLSSEGLAPEEIDAMASAFERFFELQPGTEGRSDIEAWLEWVENNRPHRGKWQEMAGAPDGARARSRDHRGGCTRPRHRRGRSARSRARLRLEEAPGFRGWRSRCRRPGTSRRKSPIRLVPSS